MFLFGFGLFVCLFHAMLFVGWQRKMGDANDIF
jgi:hypothetical protein